MSGYYHPGRLTPHVTVAEGLLTASLGRALQTVVPHLPLTGSYAALEIVDACTGVRRRLADY
jgi:hypothetical protein